MEGNNDNIKRAASLHQNFAKSHKSVGISSSSVSLLLAPEQWTGLQVYGEEEDWQFYYVCMFADRVTLMRFRGGGIGHLITREATRKFEEAECLVGFRQIPTGEVSEDVPELSDEEGETEGSSDEEVEEVGEEDGVWEDNNEGVADDLTVGDLGYGQADNQHQDRSGSGNSRDACIIRASSVLEQSL
ncbi:uncharacterized protein SCHCODRAFT_02713408 [Schizophyllum commune H4-8]|nr:uncharacterized protein SCHCODRAFT_02713408 [Schizophyllum commune H4-8]KAI5887580.1 hypothetical protein SCHCODRAFT_02713408 [Schizophyllum commune H4-8]